MNPLPLTSIDIVLTVYNQEKIIERIVDGILKNTTTPFNLIFVFDACVDKSKENALSFIQRMTPKLLKDVRVLETEDVHETKANNVGLRASTSDYVIIIQDDMEILENGWERKLTFPLRTLPNILAVGARGALDIVSMSPELQEYKNRAGREYFNLSRNIFAIRDWINRGPIAFDRKRLAELGFFDERFAPCNLDDANLCLYAWKMKGWRSGVYWIDYFSNIKWGKTKQTPLALRKEVPSRMKNAAFIASDYREYLQKGEKHSEDIYIPWRTVDYLDGISKNSIMFRYLISEVRLFFRTFLVSKIQWIFFKLKMSRFSPLSFYRGNESHKTFGESTPETRKQTERHH